jgi:hypothetical protein
MKSIAGNSSNALVDYLVRESDAVKARVDAAKSDAEKSGILEEAREAASYRLSDTITTNSKSNDRRAVTCSAIMFATVEDTTAEKQVDFRVEQESDGKVSVSVTPFQFSPPP